MPRQARIDIPGLLQHAIVRGIERGKIFLDDIDRSQFVERLSALLAETDSDCFGWTLIPNHFHLLLRPNRLELKHFMNQSGTDHGLG
jgi:REP element-mobilizing transposase RayT